MNYLINLFIILISCTCYSQINSTYKHVGFSNNLPIFYNGNGNEYYAFIDERLKPFNIQMNCNYQLILEKNYICQKETGSYEVKLLDKILSTPYLTSYCALTEESCFYTKKGTDEIWNIQDGKDHFYNTHGYVVSVQNEKLYFTKEMDNGTVGANVDLFSKSLSEGGEVCIAQGISGEMTVIADDVKIIFDMILVNGKFRPCIIPMGTPGNYQILEIEPEFLNVKPVYDSTNEELIFYQLFPFKTRVININN